MSLSHTLVSVVIPARNVAEWIGLCLDSLIAQDHQNWQAIVVENCSTDATASIVRHYLDPRIKLIESTEPGVSRARNLGLSIVEGPIVVFLDADDMLHPSALGRLATRLDAEPELVATFGTYRLIDEQGSLLDGGITLPQSPPTSAELLETLLSGNFFANGGHIAVRREALARVTLFDSSIALGEDWVVWTRLASLGSFAFVGAEPEILLFRQRETSAFRRLACDVTNFTPCLNAIFTDPMVAGAVPSARLAKLRKAGEAQCMWVAGRENFRHGYGNRGVWLMIRSLAIHPQLRRAVLMLIALLTPWLAARISGELCRYRFAKHS